MIELIIKSNDSDQRVDKFLFKVMQNCSKSMIYKWIRLKKIKVNRKRCEINQRLIEGDVVQFFIPHEFLITANDINYDFIGSNTNLDIEYENDQFLVVWKKKGVIVHPDKQNTKNTLIQQVLHYLYQTKQYDPTQEQSFTPSLIHRLDRNTEGYVIVAKTYQSLKDLNKLMRQHQITKKYVAIIENSLQQEGVLNDYHFKDSNGKITISHTFKLNYKPIITKYQILETKNNLHLVEIELITGKSHQIRAQFAKYGNVLYGDQRYGSKYKDDYQALCAYKLSFFYEKSYQFQRDVNSVSEKFKKL